MEPRNFSQVHFFYDGPQQLHLGREMEKKNNHPNPFHNKREVNAFIIFGDPSHSLSYNLIQLLRIPAVLEKLISNQCSSCWAQFHFLNFQSSTANESKANCWRLLSGEAWSSAELPPPWSTRLATSLFVLVLLMSASAVDRRLCAQPPCSGAAIKVPSVPIAHSASVQRVLFTAFCLPLVGFSGGHRAWRLRERCSRMDGQLKVENNSDFVLAQQRPK